jgi:hypothetical protein
MLTILLLLFLGLAWGLAEAAECFDDPPGEVGIRFDTPDRVKLTELVVTAKGERAYVTTEYIGAGNLQASVYLKRGGRYCLAGDLGAAVAFRSSRQTRSAGYYGLVVESKSGSDKFFRTFKYRAGEYSLATCEVKGPSSSMRVCTDSER